jgi:hypothetical protein
MAAHRASDGASSGGKNMRHTTHLANSIAISIATCIAALAMSPPAAAGTRSVARLVAVQGNVLVSNDNTIASAGEALRLSPGMRVLATLNSEATIEYDGGCRVRVPAGERAEVRRESPCQARALQATGYAAVIGARR